jgi:hypothetical protein
MTLSIDESSTPQTAAKTRHNYHLVTFRTACRLQLFAAMRLPLAVTMPRPLSCEKQVDVLDLFYGCAM